MSSRSDARKQAAADALKEWRSVADMPGTHLYWRTVGKYLYDIVSDTTTLATAQFKMAGAATLSIDADGRRAEYESRRLGPWLPGPFAIYGRRALVNTATGAAAIEKRGHHVDRKAAGTLMLPGQGTFRFPVEGAQREYAVMSAIDESGSVVAKYRFRDPVPTMTPWGSSKLEGAEVVIAPDLHTSTESILLLVALSTEWLWSFFVRTGGG